MQTDPGTMLSRFKPLPSACQLGGSSTLRLGILVCKTQQSSVYCGQSLGVLSEIMRLVWPSYEEVAGSSLVQSQPRRLARGNRDRKEGNVQPGCT